jgi:hypothetical protein
MWSITDPTWFCNSDCTFIASQNFCDPVFIFYLIENIFLIFWEFFYSLI